MTLEPWFTTLALARIIIYSVIVPATVIMIVNFDRTVITIVNYDRKTFIVQAADFFKRFEPDKFLLGVTPSEIFKLE
jgi:hypothetical protein